MPKRKYFKKNKQSVIDKISAVAEKAPAKTHRAEAANVVGFFSRNGYIPSNLKKRCEELVELNKGLWRKDTKRIIKRHYLYAISDGEFVKIGYSVNPNDRLRKMQTSNCRKLCLIWDCYVSENDKEAATQEKKLHRAIKKYHVRGEWHKKECMSIVESWVVKTRSANQERKGVKENQVLDDEFNRIMSSF